MAELVPADVWPRIIGYAPEMLYGVSVLSAQMARILRDRRFDATWEQALRRAARDVEGAGAAARDVEEAGAAPRGAAEHAVQDLALLEDLREATRGFFASRAAHRRPDDVRHWLEEHAPRLVNTNVWGLAVAGDGTVAYIADSTLHVRRGDAYLGSLRVFCSRPAPTQWGRLTFAMGSERICVRLGASTAVIDTATVKQLYVTESSTVMGIGGDWVLEETHDPVDAASELLNMRTGVRKQVSSWLSAANEHTLITEDIEHLVDADGVQQTIVNEWDARTGEFRRAIRLEPARSFSLHGRTLYVRLLDKDKTLVSYDLDTSATTRLVNCAEHLNFLVVDEETLILGSYSFFTVYQKGAPTHVIDRVRGAPNAGYLNFQVGSAGRRIFMVHGWVRGAPLYEFTL